MTFYSLETKLQGGRFKDKPLRHLIDTGQSFYIDAYAIYVSDFYISKQVIEEIKSLDPGFYISDEAMQCLNEKYNKWAV